MKLHKNDNSNKSSMVAQTFCHPGLSSLCPGATYMYKIIKKIYVKSEFKTVLLKLTANDLSDNSFL